MLGAVIGDIVGSDHPEGLKGAAATAVAIYLARTQTHPQRIKRDLSNAFGYDLDRSVDEIRPTYVHNETCQETVPQALVCALTADSFEDAIRNAVSLGGDSDTLAAIAGGVAEALFGIPDAIADQGLSYLPAEMRDLLTLLYRSANR